MFAPKCGGCVRAILENYISALSSLWHPECFVCRVSNSDFRAALSGGREGSLGPVRRGQVGGGGGDAVSLIRRSASPRL